MSRVVHQNEAATVKEGYYRWSDIVWRWPLAFKKYDRCALNALLHSKGLSDPTHPLREHGKDGVELFIGTHVDGKKQLLFSLRQVEYIVEYIFQLRLNDPAWIEYLATLQTAPDSNPTPPAINPQIKHISLPSSFLPKDLFVNIETTTANKSNVKTLDKKLKKYNNNLKRQLHDDGVVPMPESESPSSSRTSSAPSTPNPPQLELFEPDVDTNDSEALQQAFNQALSAVTDNPPSPDPADYFDLAQQAVFAASHGGAFNALNKVNPPGWNTSSLEEYLAPAVGRSLFLSLEMRARDDDPFKVVDIGYAGLWYALDPNDLSKYEVAQECGHWVAQEERGEALAATTSPFHFGDTLPFPRDSLLSKLNRKILELWTKAGQGPIYIVLHSVDNDYIKFGDLGLPVANWHTSLHPVDWKYPGHSAPEAIGQRMLVDTALLWGAIENGQPGDKTEHGVTTRSVKSIFELLAPGEFAAIDDKSNSGNKAMLTFILFDNLLNNNTLKEQRDQAHLYLIREVMAEKVSTMATATSETSTAVDDNVAPSSPLVSDDEDDDDDDDEEFAGVRACYMNDKGELVAYGSETNDDE